MFRRLEFELSNTVKEDVEMAADYFVPVPRAESKGLRVIVK